MMSTAVFQNNRKDSPNIPVLACACEASGSSDSNIGLYINATGATQYDDDLRSGNHALYIPSGSICGFRPRSRNLSTSQTLDDMDSTIFTFNTNWITLYLPSSPKDNQAYYIRRCESGGVTISGGGHFITYKNRSNTNTTVDVGGWQGVILLWNRTYNIWWIDYTTRM